MCILPPVVTRVFSKYHKQLADVVVSTAENETLAASKELHDLYGVDHSEVLSITVSGDGTWTKRGHVLR